MLRAKIEGLEATVEKLTNKTEVLEEEVKQIGFSVSEFVKRIASRALTSQGEECK